VRWTETFQQTQAISPTTHT